VLREAGCEVFRPAILRYAKVPLNQLSRRQRESARTVVRRPAALLGCYALVRGVTLPILAAMKGGLVVGGTGRPAQVPAQLVDRIAAYMDDGGAVPNVTVGRMLGLTGDEELLATKVADVTAEQLVRAIVAA